MNSGAFIILLVLGMLMLYVKLSWVGVIFFLLAFIVLIYNPSKKNAKKAWEEVKSAKGESVEKEFEGYFKNAGKLTAEAMTRKEGTQYRITDPAKFSPASKNFFSELKNLFK